MQEKSLYSFSVSVKVDYLKEQSNPSADEYAFAYTVTITNEGNIAAQLISRHWIITDENGSVNEVRGLGVIGEQPLLQPNEQFQYVSGTIIHTPTGTMKGSYQIVAEDGQQFEALIAPFMLSIPRVLH